MTERERLRQVWEAFGCAQNPNDFHPSVREQMWQQVLEMARESVAQGSRIHRENQELEAEVIRLRAEIESEWA